MHTLLLQRISVGLRGVSRLALLALVAFVPGCGGSSTDLADFGSGDHVTGTDSMAETMEEVGGTFVDKTCNPRFLEVGEVRAKPVVCPEELPGGPNAIGAVGDFLIENNRVRFIIRADEAHVFVGMPGGNLVDADRARLPGKSGQDRLQEILPLFAFNALATDSLAITNPGADGEATITASGPSMGVPILASLLPFLQVLGANWTNEYILKADADYLILRTLIVMDSDQPATDVVPIDGFFASGSLSGFEPGPNLSGDPGVEIPILLRHGPGVSYGYLGSKGYDLVSLGAVALAMGESVSVSAGGEMVVDRYLFVGDGSVSSITDKVAAFLGLPTGDVSGCISLGDSSVAMGYEVLATDSEGLPLTSFKTDEQGCFSGLLPPGPATLTANCSGCNGGTPLAIDVVPGTDDTRDLVVEAEPESFLQVTALEKGEGVIPARITTESLDPNDGTVRYFLAWPAGRLFPLPPGPYRITASRGFEYERKVLEEVSMKAGHTETLDFTLERSVATPGAAAAEFHIHSDNSVDSFVPLPERVRSCAAEGVEFVVATDHDFITDYQPLVQSLSLEPFLMSAPGEEMSSVEAGHMNVWPLVPDPDLSGNGAFAWFGLTPGEIVRALRKDHPERVVQVNHPRFQEESTFDLIDFDPTDGLAHADPVDLGFSADTDLNELDFDSMEIFNGIGDEELEEQILDWYSLLNLGRRITATAGGDSHDNKAFPGNPRNLVFVDEDDPASLTADLINGAVRSMRVLVTSGPYLEAGLVDPVTSIPSLPGDLVTDSDGEVELFVRVQAPTWMEVTELSIVRNGGVVQVIPVADAGAPELRPVLRFEQILPLPAAGDSWFVVRVRGTTKEPHQANHVPIAISNPFYLDADGDGQFLPPGL